MLLLAFDKLGVIEKTQTGSIYSSTSPLPLHEILQYTMIK